jgi:hypothetical protein
MIYRKFNRLSTKFSHPDTEKERAVYDVALELFASARTCFGRESCDIFR